MVGKHPLRLYRESKGLTRKALGKELDVSEVTVGRWESGTRSVRKTLLPKVQEVTGIEPAAILNFDLKREAAQ